MIKRGVWRRSRSGLVIYFCGAPIWLRSKSQRGMTLSTTESEYYAMPELCSELLFIKQFLEFLNMSIEYPMVIWLENM